MDTVSRKNRSLIMSRVRSKGNRSTELRLIKLFASLNINGWRRSSTILGHPDFVFKDKKIAIFADGCFWHGHKCRNTTPQTNSRFWADKINMNRVRDMRVNRNLRDHGWHVFRVWECQLSKGKLPSALLKLLRVA